MTAPPGPRPVAGAGGRTAEILLVFARLGATTFGGPAAHIAVFEDEFVRRRAWVTREEFLALNAAAQLIPGPNSTELAIHLGHRRGGWTGLVAAGLGFILPAALLTLGVAWAYVRYGALPAVTPALAGVKLAVLVIVVRALHDFARTALTSGRLAAMAFMSAVAVALGANEVMVLLLAGLLAWAFDRRRAESLPGVAWLGLPLLPTPDSRLLTLLLAFAKIGALLFGSGYVLYAFLHAEFVDRLGWLTTGQVTDAIAAGQITPGPLFSTATFVGFVVAGWTGGIVATLGIFLPAFLFVAVSAPLLPLVERHPALRAARDGVVAASLGLLAVTALALGADALAVRPLLALVVLAPATFAVVRWKVDPVLLVGWGALLGLLVA